MALYLDAKAHFHFSLVPSFALLSPSVCHSFLMSEHCTYSDATEPVSLYVCYPNDPGSFENKTPASREHQHAHTDTHKLPQWSRVGETLAYRGQHSGYANCTAMPDLVTMEHLCVPCACVSFCVRPAYYVARSHKEFTTDGCAVHRQSEQSWRRRSTYWKVGMASCLSNRQILFFCTFHQNSLELNMKFKF